MADNELVQGYRFAGDIEVKRCLLISQNGTVVDISTLALEVNIFQNLFEHYLQCEVVMSDALALWNSDAFRGSRENGIQGGYNGGEVLLISYKTRAKDLKVKTHLFGVYDVGDRQRVDEKIETYVLNGVSAESYRTSTKKISRAFGGTKGNLISNMVKTVVDEFIYDNSIQSFYDNYNNIFKINVKKEISITPTNGLQRYVIPNMTVDDTIDLFAKEADNDIHIPYYTFYENSKGYNFSDLNNLVQQEPKERYVYVATNVKDDDDDSTKVQDYQKIISYNVLRMTNIVGNAKAGLFRSKMINLDILRKNKSEVVFDYEKEYSKFNKLQKWKIPGTVEGDSVVYLFNSRIGHDSDDLLKAENPTPKRINQNIQRQQAYSRHIFNTLVEVSVTGNSELDVGDIITLDIPKATTLDKSDNTRDKYLSGKYLITKIRHKFGGQTGSTFTTILECVKDTGIEI